MSFGQISNGQHLRREKAAAFARAFASACAIAALVWVIDSPAALVFAAAVASVWIAVAHASRRTLMLENAALKSRLSEEHSYATFVEHSLDGFFRTTRDGRYLTANPALARIYGYDSVTQLKHELTDIANGLYLDAARRMEFLEAMRSTGVVKDFVSQIRRRDGRKIWISENGRAVYDGGGSFLFYEGTVQDITLRRESEAATRLALQEAQEAAQAKAAFLASMSHELKTPLNAIIGFSDLMRQETFGALGVPRYAAYVGHIYENGERLLTLINDVLDFTRAEGQLLQLELEPVSVDDVVAAALPRHSSGEALPKVSLDVPPDLPLLNVDRKRFRQALAHLIANAVKFTRAEGEIRITAERSGEGEVRIAVSDTGIGMAPERIAHALQPFKQLDTRIARKFDGVGIGLPLARALLALHDAGLSIESSPGRGTTVTITVPAQRVLERTRVLVA